MATVLQPIVNELNTILVQLRTELRGLQTDVDGAGIAIKLADLFVLAVLLFLQDLPRRFAWIVADLQSVCHKYQRIESTQQHTLTLMSSNTPLRQSNTPALNMSRSNESPHPNRIAPRLRRLFAAIKALYTFPCPAIEVLPHHTHSSWFAPHTRRRK